MILVISVSATSKQTFKEDYGFIRIDGKAIAVIWTMS